jgi:putative nucleotidyltransferase with HDIG domain
MPRVKHNRKLTRRDPSRLAWRIFLFALLLSLFLGAILVIPFLPGAISPNEVEVGFPSPDNLQSPVTTRYVSQILTQRDQEAAVAAVSDKFRFDPSISIQQYQILSDTLQLIEETLLDPELDREGREDQILSIEGIDLSLDTFELLLILQQREWEALKNEAMRLYGEMAYDPQNPADVVELREEDLELVRESLPSRVQNTFYPRKRILIGELIAPFLVPNYVVDQEETERLREEARDKTPPHYVEVLEGELILYKGQIAQALDLEKLEAVGLLSRETTWPDLVGPALLVVGLVGSYSAFLFRFQKKILRSVRRLLLLGLIIVVTVVAAKFLVPGRVGWAYAFPLPTASILMVLLLDPFTALGGAVLLSTLIGFVGGMSLELAVLGLAGSLVGILSIWKAQRSNVFLFTGFYITLINLVVWGSFRLLNYDMDPYALGIGATSCAINGFASAALCFASFGFLGNLFGQVTVLQLMELANPTQPLLSRLMQEAPGTYYHSIVVGNLAERAAELVGADPLLTRVGAYYHDVGKVIRPYFFIDNQAGRINVHDELPPRTSAQLITDHVRDGIELARKYRLPEQIVRFIPEHHGTSMATYFYRRALQEDEKVNPDDFRYPGPKPQSKETAILMLADSVEATVRAMDQSGKLRELLDSAKNGEDPLDKLVDDIMDKRVQDGQLDDCDLTFRDLRDIRQAFVSMLRGIYHPRISYPELGTSQGNSS